MQDSKDKIWNMMKTEQGQKFVENTYASKRKRGSMPILTPKEDKCNICESPIKEGPKPYEEEYVVVENEKVFEVGTAKYINGEWRFDKTLFENATYKEAYMFARDNSEGTVLILYNSKENRSELFEDGECMN